MVDAAAAGARALRGGAREKSAAGLVATASGVGGAVRAISGGVQAMETFGDASARGYDGDLGCGLGCAVGVSWSCAVSAMGLSGAVGSVGVPASQLDYLQGLDGP